MADSLSVICQRLARQTALRRAPARDGEPRFFCDAGLGGLARWLRAAGYDALWIPDIDDEALVKQAAQNGRTVLTTDSIMMERRVFRDGVIPALWLSPALTVQAQLAVVFQEFGLALNDSRCMSCGGELERRTKENLRARLPPRTYQWLDEFFECRRCGKLYWHGTHWGRIREELERARAGIDNRK